jgi:hypothetical protein
MLRVTVTRSINIIFALLTCQLFLGLVRESSGKLFVNELFCAIAQTEKNNVKKKREIVFIILINFCA